MKKLYLLNGLPSKFNDFHDKCRCPVCSLTKTTKFVKDKFAHCLQYQPGEYLTMDYSFWNTKSIRGFTDLLSVVCILTRFSFASPT